MCPQCSGGMQRDDESWFCEFCGHLIPIDAGATDEAMASTHVDVDTEQVLEGIIKGNTGRRG